MARIAELDRLLAGIVADIRRLVRGWEGDDGKDGIKHYDPLLTALARCDEYDSTGWPAGGQSVRGGSSDPLPLRAVLAAAPGTRTPDDPTKPAEAVWAPLDAWAAERHEAEVTLRTVADGVAWLTAFAARMTPSKKNPEGTNITQCHDCQRTIVDSYDPIAERLDKPKAGRCTYRIDDETGLPTEGCYTRWERERKARYRAGLADAEFAEGMDVPGDVGAGS